MRIGYFIKDDRLHLNPRVDNLLLGLQAEDYDVYEIKNKRDILPATEMVMSLGGDGAFLSATKRVAEAGLPLLGVNFGRLGFLSEHNPEDVLLGVPSGKYRIEDRVLLHAELFENGRKITPEGIGTSFWPYALNEVSVHRQGAAVLGVNVTVDGRQLPTYWADGLLVATASGSTAYSLSIGGPICMPEAMVLVIAPIAPHNLNVRPLVVPRTSKISISLVSREDLSVMTMDNRSLTVTPDTRIEVSMAQFMLKKVRLDSSSFVNALCSKLFWGEDIRNNG